MSGYEVKVKDGGNNLSPEEEGEEQDDDGDECEVRDKEGEHHLSPEEEEEEEMARETSGREHERKENRKWKLKEMKA